MLSPTDLTGVWVPIVTPFIDGDLDLDSLARLCERLLDEGVNGLVPCGTTGEAPTLTEAERAAVIACVHDVAGDRMMAGTGAIGTADTIRLTKQAAELGAGAALVISPFFVTPTQEEIRGHYIAVADASPIPILVYNFPARTGTAVEAETTLQLAGHPGVVGTKQSVAAIDPQLQMLLLDAPADFAVLIGSALAFFAALVLGARGGILAAANLEASTFLDLHQAVRDGDVDRAAHLHRDVFPRLASIEGPSGIKRRLNELGVIRSAEMRPPLS